MTPLAYIALFFGIGAVLFALFIDHVDKKNHERRKMEITKNSG
ncbi:MAG: hypothetical protein QM537_08620 [Candidatus Symbiobacter sp.]|nr:hypothetical protein [Candidatus Symbiobacter sp.]